MAETITADMIIHDIVTRHPETVKVFHGHGLPCTACAVGSRESVTGGARTHRFTPEKLDQLMQDLNASINGQPVSVAPKKAPVGRGVPLTMLSGDPNRKIKQVIAVMSGKGGVGKSLVTGLLAVSLRRQGLRVGILDGDITGPSIARMFGTKGQPGRSADGGMEPLVSKNGVKVMSMNMFLENESDPVIWRGPMISSAIKQFYSEVDWGQLDYLLVDLPPGTSDAPMVVKKCIGMVRQLKGIIVGVVENTAYFQTPDGERYEIFGPSNGPDLINLTGAPLLYLFSIVSILTSMYDVVIFVFKQNTAYDILAMNFINTLK